MNKILNSIVRIRPVENRDVKDLQGLYKILDSCNGSAAKAQAIIKESRDSLMSKTFQSLTLIAEILDENLAPQEIVATGRLILLDGNDEEQPLMYEDTQSGLELTHRVNEPALEMAGMVTKTEWEGQGIGKAMTAVRALIARNFNGITGADKIFVEFLPSYDVEGTKENSFWRDLILKHIKESNMLTEAILLCSELTGETVLTEQDLLTTLAKAKLEHRNQIIKKYFPKVIKNSDITAAAREITENVGSKTMGALINLERAYGSARFERTGMFPIDGGPNYQTETQYGALGEKTVNCAYTDDSVEDEKIMSHIPNRLIVWKPRSHTLRDLRDSKYYLTPGILGPRTAKLPREISNATNIASGESISAFKLPSSSSRKTNQ